jgi:hypothetical protein
VWHDVAGLSRLIGDLTEQTQTVACGVATGRALSPLSEPPKLAPTEPLQVLVDELAQATRRQSRAVAKTGVFLQLAEPPALDDEAALRDQLAALTAAVHQTSLWQARCDRLRDVSPPPVPETTRELAACVSQWDAALEQRQQCEDALATVTAEWTHAQATLRESAAGSHCRVCGAALDPDRVLAHAVAGLEGHAHE